MKQIVAKGIVLARTNFQEADRIITVLTPDQGKIRLLAKGVRRQKSKLAGGIELFSVADVAYMPGRGELGTLISSRLDKHFGNIVRDINRTMYGYELLKRINKITEEVVEPEYFSLLVAALAGLDDMTVPLDTVELWFGMQLLNLTGHVPNLQTDTNGTKLSAEAAYSFNFDDMSFAEDSNGKVNASLIKMLRLSISASTPAVLARIKGSESVLAESLQLAKSMQKLYLVA